MPVVNRCDNFDRCKGNGHIDLSKMRHLVSRNCPLNKTDQTDVPRSVKTDMSLTQYQDFDSESDISKNSLVCNKYAYYFRGMVLKNFMAKNGEIKFTVNNGSSRNHWLNRKLGLKTNKHVCKK